MKQKCRKFSKKLFAMLVSLVMLAALLPTTTLAKESSTLGLTTDEGKIIIPFEKIWIDEGNLQVKPQSITVYLYKYTGSLDTSVTTPIKTAVVTEQSDGKWKTTFDISNEPLFDNDGNIYKFAVVESPVANYNEVVSRHVDPLVTFIPPSVGNNWERITPCSELDIQNDSSAKSIVIAKKGRNYIVWSVDALSPTERQAVFETAKTISGMGGAKFANFTWISGLNGSYNGMTVTSDKVIFTNPSDWSFFATGTYNKSSIESNSSSITNKAQPVTYPVIVNYYKDSVTNPSDTAHFLGTQNLGEFEADDTITLNGAQLDTYKPADGYISGVQQGTVPYVVVEGAGNVINVLYEVETFGVTVNYYKDSVTNPGDAAHFLGTQNLGNYENGDTITLNGTQLDAYKPADGYISGVQQGTVPYTVVKGADNVINVLYEVETFEVIVNYYKDSVTNPGDAAHFLGTQNLGNYENGDTITLNGTQLDAYKPADGYISGVQQGTVPYVVVSSDDNVINVLYVTEKFDVIVNYYKDSVTDPSDTAAYLGTQNLGEFEADDTIALNAAQLDAYRPVDGYVSGVQQGAVPYVVVSSDDNVINVLYVAETFPVTVNYYKDSVTNPDDAATFLGSSVFADEFRANSEITLVDGTAATQLDFFKPDNYVSGIQTGSVPFIVTKGEDNVINVLYVKETFLVTVNYYKDNVTTPDDVDTFLGSAVFETPFEIGAEITLEDGTAATQLDFLKPVSGYNSGLQDGDTPYVVVKGDNVINVVYYEEEIIVDPEPPLVGPTDPLEEEIPDEDVPLAPPKTGDAVLPAALAVLMALMAAGGFLLRKKANSE